ncbi:MAG: 4Fe-4S dicluster domain-containing protein [Rhodothermales bacterium]|nr:4Fe-4S dicluster domain-containing protein [Rhodothermales bacterium]
MNYGFLIRNDRCIGCHACSTACKSENEVPLGVNRTWVKSVEVGTYPNVRRQFQVTRCNHCANPPCVRICPVTAMYQRDDGIVEFDPDVCIGCKACLQACPYDAIYIDPNSGTAAKCHYCAHRVEMHLEPACVVVCPEHAIIAGDIDDPLSEISQMIASSNVTVRKPEQGTAPKLFYVDGSEANLTPTAVERTPASFAWADVLPLHRSEDQFGGDGHRGREPEPPRPTSRRSSSGASLRSPQAQGVPSGGPIVIGEGRMADQMVQVTYNAQHKVPWHWPVPAYLVTKGIASGAFLLVALGFGLGLVRFDSTAFVTAASLSVFFTLLTTGLLVYDLERPERFLRIVFRPQWRSWLVRGAFLLIGFSVVASLWLLLEAAAVLGVGPAGLAESVRPALLWVGTPLAFGAAVYTAFLFGQAEGRDLWQSTLLPFHLVVQSLLAGSASMLTVALVVTLPPDLVELSKTILAATLLIDLLMVLAGEFGMPHASEAAARAAHEISHGRYQRLYRAGVLLLGHVVPLGLFVLAGPIALAGASVAAVIGLYLYEYAFVMAPQEVPNS